MKNFLAHLFVVLALFGISQAAAQNVTPYVNPFIGTDGDHGQVAPGATVPFGMINVCPDSHDRTHAGYNYGDSRVRGISINRVSGVGCSGAGGNISLKPSRLKDEIRIDKKTEKASPGYYEATLSNGVSIKLTATHNVAIEEYTFSGNEARLNIDFGASREKAREVSYKFTSSTEAEGFVRAPNVCGRGSYKLFFHLKTSQPFKIEEEKDNKADLLFPNGTKRPVEIRIAVSSIDSDSAKKENTLIARKSFKQLQGEAIAQWEKTLSKIAVETSSEDKVLFYTNLYRVYHSPANVTSAAGKFTGTDGKTYSAKGFTYYSSWSIWDTFRTKFPLLVLTEADRMSDISQSLIHLYQTGKKDWSTDHEATPSVRTEHTVILLLDAHRKGIKNIDFRAGYPGMQEEAKRYASKSPDQKLEASYDFWALAQIAEIIGEKDDARQYRAQSEKLFEETWKKEFMNIDDSFTKMKGNGLYQGTRWQYRWAAPQFLDKMIEWVGKEKLQAQLDTFFAQNLYNQGNEPDIHVPFLFNRFGAPEKTQDIVRRLLTTDMTHIYGGNAEFKTPYFGKAFINAPKGYMSEMDEDDGTMGAWYVFAAIGIYPMTVGSEYYEIVSPIFDKVTLRLDNGKTFTIQTKNRKDKNAPIKETRLNGQPVTDFQLAHSSILQGGTLELLY